MKREDLEKLGITDKAIQDSIMGLHGLGIEKHKAELADKTTELESLQNQFTEANKVIETFKGMGDIEAIKKSATEWESKAKDAEAQRLKEVAEVKYNSKLQLNLVGAKVKNPKAVEALLDKSKLVFDEKTGAITGFDEQIKALQEKEAYLFHSEDVEPTFTTKANGEPVISDKWTQSVREAAGLSNQK